MKPIRWRRKSVRWCSERAETSVASIRTLPALGTSRPAIRLSSVDLPEPLRPSSTMNSPARKLAFTSRSTERSVRPS